MQHYLLYRSILFAMAWLLGSALPAQAVRGRVLGPDGHPDTTARVELRRAAESNQPPVRPRQIPGIFAMLVAQSRAQESRDQPALAKSRTGASGRFALDATALESGVRYEVHVVSEAWLDTISPPFVFSGPEHDLGGLRLTRGATLKGRVVAGVSGDPIAGATVRLRGRVQKVNRKDTTYPDGPARPMGWETTTGTDGSFVFSNVPADRRMLQVLAAGFAATNRAVTPQLPATEGTGDSFQPIELALADGKVCNVRIVDRKGAPIAGVRVEQVGSSPTLVHQTDAQGRTTVIGLPARQDVVLRTFATGYFTADHKISAAGETETTLKLRRDAGVLVRVLNAEDQTSNTARIRVSSGGRTIAQAHIRRQASGEFLIRNLPQGIPLDVEARTTGGRTVLAALPQPESDKPARVSIPFQAGLRHEGKIVSHDGRPIGGATIQFQYRRPEIPATAIVNNPRPFDTRTATTDQNGAFALDDLDPGTYDVVFRCDGFASTNWRTTIDEADHATYRVSRGHTISGRVLDHSGQPAAGIPIVITASTPTPLTTQSTTDTDGRFVSPSLLPLGNVRIRATPKLGGSPLQRLQTLSKCTATLVLTGGSAPEPVTIRLPKPVQ